MAAATRRKLHVDMEAILDAMDTHGESAEFFLNTETGAVDLWLDPMITGDESVLDPSEQPWEPIPTREAREDHRLMETFAGAIDEDDIRSRLRRALDAKGGFRRF